MMKESAKYTTLRNDDSVAVYMDEYERKDILGNPTFGLFDWLLHAVVFLIWIISLPFTWYFSFKVIPQFERVVIFRLGRIRSLKGPGLISIIPVIDTWKKVDMRMRAFKVPPQEVLTLDHALIKLGADVQYRIADPISTYTLIRDIDHCLRVNGQTVLTGQVSQNELVMLQNHKLAMQQTLQSLMNKAVRDWGIEIARFELSNYVIIKNPGGLEPVGSDEKQEDCGGGAAILEVIKSFTSGGSIQMPGMMGGPGAQMMPQIPKSPNLGKSASLMGPEELFGVAKGVIDEQLCATVGAVFEVHINDGVTTRVWSLDLKNSPGYAVNGAYNGNGKVDVKLSLSLEDFQKLFFGLVKPTEAYMNGSLQVDGSVQMAQKLEHLVQKMQKTASM